MSWSDSPLNTKHDFGDAIAASSVMAELLYVRRLTTVALMEAQISPF
jgi:hypothetical protein